MEMITARTHSGKTVDEWCEDQGMSRYMYYYRLRKVRRYAAKEIMIGSNGQSEQLESGMPVFAALPTARKSGATAVTVHIGAYIAEIPNSADMEVVESVLRMLIRL